MLVNWARKNERILHMIVTTRELFDIAYGKFAIGAYNINNL
jgi:hypothetical protein